MANSKDSTDFLIQTIISDSDSSIAPISTSSFKDFNIIRAVKEHANLLKYLIIFALFCLILIALAYNLLVPKEKEFTDEDLHRIFKVFPDVIGKSISELNSDEKWLQKILTKNFSKS